MTEYQVLGVMVSIMSICINGFVYLKYLAKRRKFFGYGLWFYEKYKTLVETGPVTISYKFEGSESHIPREALLNDLRKVVNNPCKVEVLDFSERIHRYVTLGIVNDRTELEKEYYFRRRKFLEL